jgi:hypothetical protein
MKYLTKLTASAMTLAIAGWFGLAATPAYATLAQTGVCPSVIGAPSLGGGGVGSASDCNLLITFGPNGGISTSTGPQTNYESIEDALIGVVNNSGHTLNSFNISGPNIFGFEADGIDRYVAAVNGGVSPQVAGNPDTTGYGGPLGYFTNISAAKDSGTVNFYGGLGGGHTTYFSLEEPISVDAPPIISNNVPAPPMLPLFALSLIGFGWLVRRRKSA